MNLQKSPVTLLVVFGLWLGLILGCSSLRETENSKPSEREGAPIKISAEDLHNAYESNEAAAADRYEGKIVIVTGRVGIIDTVNANVILIDARQQAIVRCYEFAADQEDAVSKVKPDQTVSVKGKCTGRSKLGLVQLKDCVIQ